MEEDHPEKFAKLPPYPLISFNVDAMHRSIKAIFKAQITKYKVVGGTIIEQCASYI
jgi:hypothetical protein